MTCNEPQTLVKPAPHVLQYLLEQYGPHVSSHVQFFPPLCKGRPGGVELQTQRAPALTTTRILYTPVPALPPLTPPYKGGEGTGSMATE